jgi:hypothetical protein
MKQILIIGLVVIFFISLAGADDVPLTVTINQIVDHFESGEDVSDKLFVTYSNCNDTCNQYEIDIYEGNEPVEELNVHKQSGQLDKTLSTQTIPVTWTAARSGVYLIVANGEHKSFWVTGNNGHVNNNIQSVQIQPTPELSTMILTMVGLLGLFLLTKFGKK